MAELYICAEDKRNTKDQNLDAKCYKRNDVIEIVEDGHKWAKGELGRSDRVIAKAPGVDVDKLTALLIAEPGDPNVKQNLQRRAFSFDLNAYAQMPQDKLTLQDCITLTTHKPPLVDPKVIGAKPDVIG